MAIINMGGGWGGGALERSGDMTSASRLDESDQWGVRGLS